MAENYPTTSLDYWRKFFNCANADVFQVIKYAILVASVDSPAEFLSYRDEITEILYARFPMQCSSDRAELQTPEDVVEDDDDESSEDTQKESNERERGNSEECEATISNQQSISDRSQFSNLDEFEALTNEIEEEQQTVGEVLRIKELLANWREESEKVLSESLRRLQLMELSIETLSATKIGKSVKALYKHKSKSIRQLAQTLVKGWKLLVEEWVTATTVSQEPSPVSIEPSPAKEESPLISELDFPPLDMGALLATQTAPFEFSKFFEGMDDDGNITSTGNKSNVSRPSVKKDNVEVTRQEVPKASKPTDTTHKAPKNKEDKHPVSESNTQRRQKSQEHSREFRNQEAGFRVSKPIDASHKTSKPSERGTAHNNTQQRQKPSGVPSKPCTFKKDALKESEESDYRIKLEVAKRKLQDRYQEVQDAKRQRTIQVMELKDLPRQSQNKIQQPVIKRGKFFNRSANKKSK
ncbi:uncharacterized protein A4U43_C02F19550 [Asparagus officinalis]|uniref:TFIIS N-terminal domain-containing protein n=2 Tax=Asparagus officinalis TaxID=4686 RepID=A0A5P1FP93_ASPOF|nr:uncharacterized protein A4U43_C02F19550 [Asparagus officinalis]